MRFPAPPRPLKALVLVTAGTATTPIPKFCNRVHFWIFHFLSPLPTSYRWGVRLWSNRTKKQGSPGTEPGAPSVASDQSGNKRGSGTHEPCIPGPRPLSKGEQPEDVWEVRPAPSQLTDLHAAGVSGRGCQQPPRTGLRYFISSFRKTCQKQLCLTAMCSFFLPFFS